MADCECDRNDCLACVKAGSEMWARMYRDAEHRYRAEQLRRIRAEAALERAISALATTLEDGDDDE